MKALDDSWIMCEKRGKATLNQWYDLFYSLIKRRDFYIFFFIENSNSFFISFNNSLTTMIFSLSFLLFLLQTHYALAQCSNTTCWQHGSGRQEQIHSSPLYSTSFSDVFATVMTLKGHRDPRSMSELSFSPYTSQPSNLRKIFLMDCLYKFSLTTTNRVLDGILLLLMS